MAVVRLASRAVIGVFRPPKDLGPLVADLENLGVAPVEISILGPAEALGSTVVLPRRPGLFDVLRKPRAARLDLAAIGRDGVRLVGAGPLLAALQGSPSTSVVGALVMQGIPQRDAVVYADFLAEGGILALVGVADRTQGERVRTLLSRAGAETAGYYAGRPYGTAFHGTGPGLS